MTGAESPAGGAEPVVPEVTEAGISPVWVVVLGAAAAVPSLLWALDGSGFIHDDWSIASGVELGSTWDAITGRSTGTSARPLSAVYFALTHEVFGAHPLLHVLALAALNGLAASLLVRVGTRLVGRQIAVWTALVWVALPNRGSTRLWITMAPAVVSLCLLLVAIALLLADRPVAAGVVMASAILLYEAVAGVALAALALWPWRSRGAAWRRAAGPIVVVLGASAFIYLGSPKRELDAAPFSNWANIVAAQFGRGVFGPLARVGALLMLVAFTVALVRALLPSFRAGFSAVDRAVLAGTALVFVGAAPFFVAGFPFATDGIFDRGNLVAGLGTALILGALLSWVSGLA
ncbi:MAG: hypothetical protein ACRD0S_10990, partial [Acidimicrobiales bacterium]